MHDPASKPPFDPSIPVSPNNPCPFLRGLVGEGFVEGGTVPLGKLSETIANATGETGLKKASARLQVRGVALIANGFKHILKSIFSGAQLDALRDGPLDKHGAGSRILGVDGKVNEDEITRLASFGRTYTDPNGGSELGLNASDIKLFMRDNLKRAGSAARWYYPLLMKFEWPILLKIIGKGTGENRYLSVADVRTLFNERQFPARINQLLVPPVLSTCQRVVRGALKLAAVLIAIGLVALVAVAEFPNQVRAMLPQKGILVNLLPPPLPAVPETKAAFWLEQNWSLKDRHWFHHASQGTATFPVPYEWFVALEQPRLHLFSKPGLMKDSGYLEGFGFIPSPQSIQTDTTTLRRFGYANVYETTQVPDWSTRWTPAENVDGLPVGFARMTGVVDPATGRRENDMIGLTCAACHTGQIHYQGVDVRFDGGPAMTDLKKLELSTGLSIAYTLYVPFRFQRFADRVLGPNASKTDRAALKQKLSAIGTFLIDWQKTYEATIEGKKTWDGKEQQDTVEGFGRLDALNRIGNQVFSQDLALSGVKGFEKNLHAQDAPVSYPAIWTVPWFKFAQYDASIEQPLIRNAGEALGVTALLNLSDAYPEERIWRSSVNIRTLGWIEDMLRGPDPFKSPGPNKTFGGLLAPQWPSQILGDAWRIDQKKADNGRKIYEEMCSGCHLPAVNTDAFWSSKHWEPSGDSKVLNAVTIPLKEINTDPEQSLILSNRIVDVPSFLKVNTADLQTWWQCEVPTASKSPNEMVYALGLMTVVDLVARKWMDDEKVSDAERARLWNLARKNCLNPAPDPRYRARPLNGIWATAPYLHNGSVPSLYWLLKPASERPTRFCMGRRDYDPVTVGFAVTANETCKTGETEFSATGSDGKPIQGNSVLGHSFERKDGEPKRPGVIGRAFKDDAERYDLIEYLKTL
ncbi:cytochrome C [Bradyrhizobium sp. WBOS7]|uniref:Cytochrome C n=1 Tax=Bradyrhizobium betae TaxID=244734 RepID=A0AAE9SPC7_9BRAD|nr:MULTISPECIES: di-heme-cytochrome C peroxidase [Bradyrhizobium]MDD1570701.1 cytochrome C [Bradyrhizobium sp. WBOS1]UUO34852.1 cytochrome C [Bradyrhizobium sp. WBOS01]MDD1527547.1 cytochrome C [Bradyrhizobium sp. WBOS2]MDD1578459.1 cytochrome C [Bradyrhizobium sp. WBOS7]MDD1601182.1 cytochrome C [Bradyrhizobium sp. WBOS16]